MYFALCDTAARKALGKRASSVFPAPCRSGRRLSEQSWALFPKIRQVDEYLRLHAPDGPVVLDALVAAVTAATGAENLRTLPDAPERDGRGLRMEMVYAHASS